MAEHKVSFAKHPGAGTTAAVVPPAPPAQPAQPAQPAPAPAPAPSVAPTPTPEPQNLPAVQDPGTVGAPRSDVVAGGFYTGEEDIPETSAADQKTPWLTLIQPTSKNKIVGDVFVADGTFVYKKAVALPASGFRAVVVGFTKLVWVEKLPYIQSPGQNDPKPRIANSVEEVIAFGGTDVWEFSNANVDQRTKIPKHTTPFFDKHIKALLFVEAPAGVSDEHFPYVFEGKAYGPALFELKGGSFKGFFVPINTERKTLFKGKWSSRFILITSTRNSNNPAFTARARVGESTPEGLQALIAAEVR